MTNFEKIKQEYTNMGICEIMEELENKSDGCEYCAYDSYTCNNDCEYGMKIWLKREVTDNDKF